jgi:hypothetical protein
MLNYYNFVLLKEQMDVRISILKNKKNSTTVVFVKSQEKTLKTQKGRLQRFLSS